MWWIKQKEAQNVLIIDKSRMGLPQMGAKFHLGYHSRARAVNALIQSQILTKMGWTWDQIELVDGFGRTMEEMSCVEVRPGLYALLHVEGWFWDTYKTHRVWFARPADAEAAWTKREAFDAEQERRKCRRLGGRTGFQMVRGRASGEVEILENWFL